MYVILALLVPILLLFHTRLGLAVLVGAIVWMVFDRTRTPTRPKRRPDEDSGYEAGYK